MEITNAGPGKEFGEIEVDIVFDYDDEFIKNYMKEHNTTFEVALMAYQTMVNLRSTKDRAASGADAAFF